MKKPNPINSLNHLKINSYALLFFFSLCSVLCGGCDDEDGGGINRANNPILSVNPEEIVLNATPIGEMTRNRIQLLNSGSGELRIIAIDFSNELSSLEFQKEHSELPITIASGDQIPLDVIYSPQNAGGDRGQLIIESNSRDGLITNVEISTDEGFSELIYAPQSSFSLSPCDQELSQWITFQNLGSVPVSVREVRLSADTSSAFRVAGIRLNLEGTLTENLMSGDLIEVIQRSTLEVEVIYSRQGAGVDQGTLQIIHDGGDPYEVTLKGAELRPSVDVNPQAIEFGAFDLGEESEIREVFLTNNGSSPLNIESIALAINDPSINDQFTLHNIEIPVELQSDESFSFGVSYHPQIEAIHRTSISVNFGACQGQISIPISGRVRQPCIQVTPELVNFGRVAQNQPSAPSRLEVLNCGDAALNVTEVAFGEGADGFSWRWIDAGVTTPFVLEPRMTAPIEVTYVNNALSEGELAMTFLNIANSSPDTPTLEVPLSVIGGGVPTCDMLILPERMNFGLITRGRSATRELQAVNRGTGSCEIRSQSIDPVIAIPLPGFDQVKFTLTQPVMANQAAAGQFLPFEITYTPEVFNADAAVYNLTYFDPFSNQEKVASADLSGISGESNIEVIPSRLDFGQVTAGDCASREERVTVYNTGVVDLCITGIEFEGDNCSEFILTDRPVADADGCIIVTRNRPAEVKMVYEPGNLGEDQCELIFISDAADNPELRVPLTGEGVSNTRQVDEFVQTSGQTVDVLFVVDNSGSMSEEQSNLQNNFAEFITGAQQFQNDYQIGIVTTDMNATDQQGRLQSPRIMRRGPGIESQFSNAVDVGTSGAGDERGLAAAQAALSDPLAFDTGVACQNDSTCVAPDTCVEGYCGGTNRGFLRDNAALEIIFVSDEDDYSEANLNFYVDFFKNIKGFRNESLFHANAIVGAQNGRASSCNGSGGEASAGSRYVEVATRTNGRVFSICEEDFGGPLQEIGNQAFGLPIQFFLSRPAEQASIEVSVNSQDRSNGWMYDNPSNSIIFEEAQVPQPGQTVRVEYNAQCFPRRGD